MSIFCVLKIMFCVCDRIYRFFELEYFVIFLFSRGRDFKLDVGYVGDVINLNLYVLFLVFILLLRVIGRGFFRVNGGVYSFFGYFKFGFWGCFGWLGISGMFLLFRRGVR